MLCNAYVGAYLREAVQKYDQRTVDIAGLNSMECFTFPNVNVSMVAIFSIFSEKFRVNYRHKDKSICIKGLRGWMGFITVG